MPDRRKRLRDVVCIIYSVCFFLWIPLAILITIFGAGPSDPTRSEWLFIILLWTYPIYTGIGMAAAITRKNNWWLVTGIPGPVFIIWLVYLFTLA